MQTAICNECGELGHSANKCPVLFAVHVAFKVSNYKPASYVMSIPRHYMFTMKCDSAWPFVSSDLG
jgi:hypothetical protein